MATAPRRFHFLEPSFFDMHINIKEDLPGDLMMKLELQKQEPFPLDVPCLNGLGSCEYDMCKVFEQNQDGFCTDDWPADKPCGCPMKAGDYDLHGISVDIPDFGILNDLMVGSYKSTQYIYSKADPDNKFGCLLTTYKFIKG